MRLTFFINLRYTILHMTQPFRPKKLSVEDIRSGCLRLSDGDGVETQVCVAAEELRQGLDIISAIEKSVTFFGSARTPEDDEYYQKAQRLGKRVAELGYAVVTGGGPGIMEAANRGASEVPGAKSIGMTITLPFEQKTSPYVNEEIPFYYFFTRKVGLTYSSEAYLGFPGGFGTMDEIFEVLTLIQTQKIESIPVILIGGKDFWQPLVHFIDEILKKEFKTISEEDTQLYVVTDDEDEIIDIIKRAHIRRGDERKTSLSA